MPYNLSLDREVYESYTESVACYADVIDSCRQCAIVCDELKLPRDSSIAIGARTALQAALADLYDAKSARIEVLELLVERALGNDIDNANHVAFVSILKEELKKANGEHEMALH